MLFSGITPATHWRRCVRGWRGVLHRRASRSERYSYADAASATVIQPCSLPTVAAGHRNGASQRATPRLWRGWRGNFFGRVLDQPQRGQPLLAARHSTRVGRRWRSPCKMLAPLAALHLYQQRDIPRARDALASALQDACPTCCAAHCTAASASKQLAQPTFGAPTPSSRASPQSRGNCRQETFFGAKFASAGA